MPAEGEVSLRAVAVGDVAIFYRQQRDPEANDMAAFTPADGDDQAAFEVRWARLLSDPQNVIRTILCDGEVAGYVASFRRGADREVSYWLGREYWRRKVATRALMRLLDEIDERPIFARAAQDNAASLRVLEKCGFARIGEDRGFSRSRRREVDEFVLRLDGAKDLDRMVDPS